MKVSPILSSAAGPSAPPKVGEFTDASSAVDGVPWPTGRYSRPFPEGPP